MRFAGSINKEVEMRNVLILIALLCVVCAAAQDDYEAWKKQQQAALTDYRSAQDAAFASFLENHWKAFETFTGETPDEVPKPEDLPVAKPEPLPEITLAPRIKKIEIPTAAVEEPVVHDQRIYAPAEPEKTLQVDYYGLPLHLRYQPQPQITLATPLKEKSVADFWYQFSDTNYEKLTDDLQSTRQDLALNDWAYCLLMNSTAKQIFPADANLQRLAVWFLLTKAGYEAKVGYSENEVFLLLPSQQVMYGVTYMTMDNKRFYVVSFDSKQKIGALYTYEGSYPDADAVIDLSVNEIPVLTEEKVNRTLEFSYNGQDYTLPVTYNRTVSAFFENYPLTDIRVYFEAPLSSNVNHALTEQLSTILNGKSETEAVNILLRFVQTAFAYKTDGDQFGREKSFFGDEILSYPYSDCEDRSIFFANLVRNLLGLRVVALDYPGHIATAVHFSTDVPGDSVTYENQRYVICDPTYINANLGMEMPTFKDTPPDVIALK
jgi:hypothetical protein